MGTGRTFTIWSPERPSSGYFAAERPCCLVVFILKDGERKAILPDGNYELDNGKTLEVINSKAVEGSFNIN